MKQQEQAADAVSLFFALQKGDKAISSTAAREMALGAFFAQQENMPVATNANPASFAPSR